MRVEHNHPCYLAVKQDRKNPTGLIQYCPYRPGVLGRQSLPPLSGLTRAAGSFERMDCAQEATRKARQASAYGRFYRCSVNVRPPVKPRYR